MNQRKKQFNRCFSFSVCFPPLFALVTIHICDNFCFLGTPAHVEPTSVNHANCASFDMIVIRFVNSGTKDAGLEEGKDQRSSKDTVSEKSEK